MAARLATLGLLAGIGAASFIPEPQGVTKVLSEKYPGASIEYKRTELCETTPGAGGQTFDANMFFWYFAEARNNPETAPTSIYVAGGPGTSSFDNANNFPCFINEDVNSTTLNEFSWNTNVNMLYIDQPVGVGFSYTSLTEGTYDYLTETFTPLAEGEAVPETNVTFVRATKSNPEYAPLVNTTTTAAKYMWKFAQVWFQEFPEHQTSSEEISLWGTSYAGFWGPGFFSYFLDQNAAIESGSIADKNDKALALSTLGLGNSCLDSLIQGPSFPEFAMNNTFGFKSYSEETYAMAVANITAPEVGCNDLIAACRKAADAEDPESKGNNDSVNEICATASQVCFGVVQGAFTALSGRSPFDISLVNPAVYPPEQSFMFLNQRWVQEALGVPLNFSISNDIITSTFFGITGDPMRRSVASIEHLLDNGVSVALYYGDLDYRCSWFAGEDLSLAMDYPGAAAFRKAGYTPIQTNDTYSGGFVRQHGNVSFARVFDAGHAAAFYQPETGYRIFDRAMSGKDIASGKTDADSDYSSEGPMSVRDVTSELPASRPIVCYTFDIGITCAENQIQALVDGSAVIKDYVVVEPTADASAGQGGAGGSGTGGGSDTGAASRNSQGWYSLGLAAVVALKFLL
ncbi:unnamed protein product [Parascedosporium putredinis]|uniref:Uncharacterized protein n=1 Tax=Parascedosporium putredinis TaxID=1442378 RepID=A0A9P1GVW3_9PEZI|nr:unnamed protein product [Parascedosporium putredinis]CAI7988335.1 unnamed protein product [Parascedosporium putredinis]